MSDLTIFISAGEASGEQYGAMLIEELRSQLAAGTLSSEQEHERLRSAEEALDQCWDLLRQRRARRGVGENPDGAAARPTTEVEGYQQ